MTSDGRSQVLVSQVGGTYVPLEYIENVDELLPSISSSMLSDNSTKDIQDSSDTGRGDKEINMSLENEPDERRRASDSVSLKQNKAQKILRHASTGDMSETKIRRNSSRSSFRGSETLLSRYRLHVNSVVGSAQRNSPSSVTEVVGDLTSKSDLFDEEQKHSNIVSLCTLDGK